MRLCAWCGTEIDPVDFCPLCSDRRGPCGQPHTRLRRHGLARYCSDSCRETAGRPERPERIPRQTGLTALQSAVLLAAASGAALAEIARQTGVQRSHAGAALSACYSKLGVKDIPCHHLARDRRGFALAEARRRGWIKEG